MKRKQFGVRGRSRFGIITLLIQSGIAPRLACYVGLVSPLSDDPGMLAAMRDLVNAVLVD